MMRCHKFRLYPKEHQFKILNDTIETCRHLYNNSLGERSAGWGIGYWEQQNLLQESEITNITNRYTAKYCRMFYRD
ncbi:MAG: helix-turn-helix domain-containing protein [Nitrososphaera sp.]|uniref:Transposase putative helix-turn-helix domain-containing protein n=1 Tax=Nitrososphaera gargensis (strain Ga9.2) TaxID=1237085 RepID=K0IHN4_NITGG|nr:helix-turn-helix domain-containing protein [Candidatus Nitrososphaera gargensis]AFU59455.1 hypothetical protein Ngar_c25320 [Candidatus Nitrososphaera gargensis Ga9.2]